MMFKFIFFFLICFFSSSSVCLASVSFTPDPLTASGIGYTCLALFVVAYAFVMLEELIKLRKSKPVLLAAGLIWALVGYVFQQNGQMEEAKHAFEHNLLEYAELLLFLLVAMTYINAMEERRLFDALRTWMVSKGFGYRPLYWIAGLMAFFISPVADNLTTALLMCAIVLKVGENNRNFINLCCINIVIAANAGGAFSPFGDITTLMVWQAEKTSFFQFFDLFIPSAVNYLVPAVIMYFFLPKGVPELSSDYVSAKRGTKRIIFLFLLTICTAVSFHSAFGYPPVVGMMMGLAYLQIFGFYLRKTFPSYVEQKTAQAKANNDEDTVKRLGSVVPFDVFQRVSQAEWDTLLFFYGVVMCVGGLSILGYLELVSHSLYTQWNPLWANSLIGVLSAIVDNIPVMYAVLTMDPAMPVGHWLLVTLTAGVGGSLLSIGSAAGVALMGAARGRYTFLSHLKWTPVIFLGYIASIAIHMYLNSALF